MAGADSPKPIPGRGLAQLHEDGASLTSVAPFAVMDSDSDPELLAELAEQFTAAGNALADAIVRALPAWVLGCVNKFAADIASEESQRVAQLVADAGTGAAAAVEPPLRKLLAAPIDEQRSTPLTIVRTAVQFPTAVLQALGVAPIERDPFDARAFPLDLYGISPASWGDLGPDVGEAGLRWSVNKAFLHRHLHRARV